MILLELFWEFFKIGLFTFGGGYAMLPLIQASVESKGWMPMSDLVTFIAISESTPGPFAVNMSTYIGNVTAGIPGAVFATLGVVMPSFIVILIVARVFEAFKTSELVRGVMTGLRPAVVGLLASAALSIANAVLFAGSWSVGSADARVLALSLAIFAVCAVLAFKKKHPIMIVCLSAAIGIAAGYALGL